MSNKDFQNGVALGLAMGGIVESEGVKLNIAYGDTPPEDTSKLWIRANEPDKITFKKEVEGAESVSLLDTYLPRNEYSYVESAMGCASVGTKIYLFGGNMSVYGIDNSNSITKFTLTSPLSQGNIELQTSFLNNVFKLINTDTAQVEIGVENVYIGNDNNEAELCEAYLHNGNEWAVIE